MTADGTRPPILLIRPEGILGGPVELHLLDADGSTRLIARREGLCPDEDLETLVRVAALDEHEVQDIVVDLDQVKWLNSTGLGWLVGLARQRKMHGDTVALVGGNERIARLLQVTSLDLALPAFETLDAAVGGRCGRRVNNPQRYNALISPQLRGVVATGPSQQRADPDSTRPPRVNTPVATRSTHSSSTRVRKRPVSGGPSPVV